MKKFDLTGWDSKEMARKPLGPMDVNEYYRTMGAKSEADLWEMPIYNDATGKPLTGPGRKPVTYTGNFAAPVYNDEQGRPKISSGRNSGSGNEGGPYRIEVFRPGVAPSQMFAAPRYNDASGKPIINNTPPDVNSEYVYRPSKLKSSGVAHSSARRESLLGIGENRKVFLNNCFAANVAGASIPIASFSRISGMEMEWELETYREGGDNGGDHIFPRQIRNSHLVCEYGMGFTDPLLKWFDMTKLGMIIKLPMLIYMMSETRIPVKLWMVMDALPVKYSAPTLDAMTSEVAITRLEFIHNGLISIL